jgi:hypothetical protein
MSAQGEESYSTNVGDTRYIERWPHDPAARVSCNSNQQIDPPDLTLNPFPLFLSPAFPTPLPPDLVPGPIRRSIPLDSGPGVQKYRPESGMAPGIQFPVPTLSLGDYMEAVQAEF